MTSSPPQDELSTDAILQELRKQLREQRLQGASPEPLDSTPAGLPESPRVSDNVQRLLQELQARWQVTPQPFTSRLPLVGSLIALFRSLWNEVSTRWYLQPILQQQVDFNASVVRAVQYMGQLLALLEGEARYMRQETALSDRTNTELSRRFAQTDLLLRSMAAKLAEVQGQFARGPFSGLQERLARLEALLAPRPNPDPVPPRVRRPGAEPSLALDYFAFQARFRGSPEEVKGRQRPYLEEVTGSGLVVDLGCGRGEFLELLQEAGIPAKGVDTDPSMVAYCQGRGLPVAQGDLFEFLTGLEDSSLGGVFSAQVIEHLPSPKLLELFDLSYRKLSPGGAFLAETINPTCLLALSSHYLIDLSHEKPIHPETAAFLAESVGFREVRVRYTSPVPELARLQPLSPPPDPGLQPWYDVLNEDLRRLNDLLFSYQDYALIARKPN